MRRGQSEGIGLAIIMILIILGFLVFFLFSPDDENDPRRDSAQMMVNQFGHVFLQAEIDYGVSGTNCKRTMYALIEDVYSRGVTDLGCGETKTAEVLLVDELKKGLEDTLGLWGYNAYFEIKKNNIKQYEWPSSVNPCTNRRFGFKDYKLSGDVVVEVSMC